jgi:hypothetical protein
MWHLFTFLNRFVKYKLHKTHLFTLKPEVFSSRGIDFKPAHGSKEGLFIYDIVNQTFAKIL